MSKAEPKINLEDAQAASFALRPKMNRISAFSVKDLSPGKHQPRTKFENSKIASLAESIKRYGQLQPIIVEIDPDDTRRYRIIAGERRWRATKLLGYKEIEGILKKEVNNAEISLIENVQREGLSPLEEALAYKSLMSLRGYSQAQVGQIVGKKRTTVNEIIRITDLPGDILEELVDYPNVSKTHLVIIAQERDPQKQRSLWARARSGLLTTADTKQVKKGNKASLDISETEKAIRSLESAVTKLEKVAIFEMESANQVKGLQRRIVTALKGKGASVG